MEQQNNTNINNNTNIILPEYINHPWFIYPNALMSEYNEYGLYKNESIRLEIFLDNFQTNLKNNFYGHSEILVPIIIGSTMEEALFNSRTTRNNIFQYEQLFPNYIENFLEKDNEFKFVQLIIISPDLIFNLDKYEPIFTKLSKYNFTKINKYEYICESNLFSIRVNIFNCPMVSVEKRTNIIEKYNLFLLDLQKKNINNYDILTYTQNNYDLLLISKIYDHLENIFKYTHSNKVNVVINSWASFKNLYGYSENYKMFPELLKLASDYNIIATEWIFDEDNFFSIIISDYHFGNKSFKFQNIIYVNYYSHLVEHKIINKYLLKFKNYKFDIYQIDFSSNYNLTNSHFITINEGLDIYS